MSIEHGYWKYSPEKLDKDGWAIDERNNYARIRDSKYLITDWDPNEPEEPTDADGHLMAASPIMYEALEVIPAGGLRELAEILNRPPLLAEFRFKVQAKLYRMADLSEKAMKAARGEL